MDPVLARIKRFVRAGQFRFSRKADEERLRDGFMESEVAESILNADRIEKTLKLLISSKRLE